MSTCRHPRDQRALDHGYDITCGNCGQIIGRVALFPCAVLTQPEAKATLEGFTGRNGANARAVLEQALLTPKPGRRQAKRPKEKATSDA